MAISEFYTTRELFRSFTGYTHPLSFEDWQKSADDSKVAVLYCQFFDQITLAWYKLKSVYSTEEDGVSEVLQYLTKNVPLIMKDRKRFTPAYIYKVAYNCLYCLCRDPNRYKAAYENEMSNLVENGEDELDLFDTVASDRDEYEIHSKDQRRERFWQIIENEGDDAVVVVSKLLGEDLDWRESRIRKNGEYRRITNRDRMKVTAAREEEIIEKLRKVLAEYAELFL